MKFYALHNDVYPTVVEFDSRTDRDAFTKTAGHPVWDEKMGAHWVGSGKYAVAIPAKSPEVRKYRRELGY